MNKRNYLKLPAMGFLAGTVLTLGLGLTCQSVASAQIVLTGTDTVARGYQYVNELTASKAIYNELAALGVTTVGFTGTATDQDSIIAEVKLVLADSTQYGKVIPAIKAAAEEFPGAPEAVVAYAIGAMPDPKVENGVAPSVSFEQKLKDVVKAGIEGGALGSTEWTASGSAVAFNQNSINAIVSAAQTASANRMLAVLTSGTEKADISWNNSVNNAIVSDAKNIISQGIASGVLALGSVGTAQWDVASAVAKSVASASIADSAFFGGTNLGKAINIDRKAALAGAAFSALPKLAGNGEGAVVQALAQTAAVSGFEQEYVYRLMKVASEKNMLNAVKAGLGLVNSGSAQTVLQHVFSDYSASSVSATAATYLLRGAVELGVPAGNSVSTATFVTNVINNGGVLSDSMIIAMASGAAAGDLSHGAAIVTAVAPKIGYTDPIKVTKDSQAADAQKKKNSALLSLAQSVAVQIALASPADSASASLSSALSPVLSALSQTGTGTALVSLDTWRMNLAIAVAKSAATNAEVLNDGLKAIANTMSSGTSSVVSVSGFNPTVGSTYVTGTMSRATFAANVLNGISGNSAAVTEAARSLVTSTGFNGAVTSGTDFMAKAFAETKFPTSAAAKIAFAAGLASEYTGQVDQIATSIIASIPTIVPGITQANKNARYLDLAKAIISVKNEAGQLVADSTYITSAIGGILQTGASKNIKGDSAVLVNSLPQTDAQAQAAFAGALAKALPNQTPDIAPAIVNSTAVSGDVNKGAVAGLIVKNLGVANSLVTSSVANIMAGSGVTDKVVFLQQLIGAAGSSSAVQASTAAVSNALGTKTESTLQTFVTSVNASAPKAVTDAIDKVMAGVAVTLSSNGGSSTEVAALASSLTNHSASLSGKFAASVTAAVPTAAIKLAETLSQTTIVNSSNVVQPKGMGVGDRAKVGGNAAAGYYGNYLTLSAVNGVASTYPYMAAGVADAVVKNLYQSSSSILADKATVIGTVLGSITPFASISSDLYTQSVQNLVDYSLSGTSYSLTTTNVTVTGGAGFESLKSRELFLNKALTVAQKFNGGDLLAQYVVARAQADNQITGLTVATSGTGTSLAGFAADLIKGDSSAATQALLANSFGKENVAGGSAGTASVLFYGMAKSTLVTGSTGATLQDFAKDVLNNYFLANDFTSSSASVGSGASKVTTITSTYKTSTGMSADFIAGLAAGLSKATISGTTSNTASIVAAIASATTNGGVKTTTITASGTTVSLTGMNVTTHLVTDKAKVTLGKLAVTMDPTHYMDIAYSLASKFANVADGSSATSTYLGDLANSIANVVKTGKSYDELAAIASQVALGAASSANLTADIIGDITAKVIKLQTKAAYDIVGTMLATARALGIDIVAAKDSITLSTASLSMPSGAIASAYSAITDPTHKRDNFDVGNITRNETSVSNG